MLFDPDRPEVDELLLHAFDLDRAARPLDVNPFDNNFIREIIICKQAGLLWNPGRGETDAVGRDGGDYELKSTDIRYGRTPQWPTSREVTATVLAAFRAMDFFCFAVFDGIQLLALYKVEVSALEPVFVDLQSKLDVRSAAGKNLNNPKIPWKCVRPYAEALLLDPRFTEPPA
jgi:restriction endonuclease PvuII